MFFEFVPSLDGGGLIAVEMDKPGRGGQPRRLCLAWLVWRYGGICGG